MIGYATLGTNALERARYFYDNLFDIIGAKRSGESDRHTLWQAPSGGSKLGVYIPFDKKPATNGNGSMVGIHVESIEMVDALHTRALELGASDEGKGLRVEGKYYMGYFRDLDGNKLNLFTVI